MSLLPLQVVLVLSAWATMGQQLWRTRTSTAGLALPTWASFVTGSIAWSSYGLVVGDALQLWVNVPAGLLALGICRAAWPGAARSERRTALVVGGVVMVGSVAGATVLGVLGASVVAVALTVVSIGPQVWAVVVRSDVAGVSVPAWVTLAANQSLWVVYGVLDAQPTVVVNATFLALCSVTIATVTRVRGVRAAAV